MAQYAFDSLFLKDDKGRTPAHLAALAGRKDLIKFLKHKAPDSFFLRDKLGRTPEDILKRTRFTPNDERS